MRKFAHFTALILITFVGFHIPSAAAQKNDHYLFKPSVGVPIAFDSSNIRAVGGTRSINPNIRFQLTIFFTPAGTERLNKMTQENLDSTVNMRLTEDISVPIKLKGGMKWEVLTLTARQNTPDYNLRMHQEIRKMKERLK